MTEARPESGRARRPELSGLAIADPPERWEALGFDATGGRMLLGQVAVELGAEGQGIISWRLRGLSEVSEIDGLATSTDEPDVSGWPARHPNGALGLDHVVVVSSDFDRTRQELERVGLGLSRIRDAGGFRQGFRRLGPAILELVEAPGEGPARFWGLVVIVNDLGALADRLGEQLGTIRPAVQAGRQIATLRASAGLSAKVAFMDPE